MDTDRWSKAQVERGKPRVYIQQYLDLRMAEEEYEAICKKLGQDKPYEDDTAAVVMEEFLESLGDGSQCDAVHLTRGDGLVVLMTVVSYPYKQETYDRLMATHLAKKSLGAE